jgi:CRISPR-associated protein Csm1
MKMFQKPDRREVELAALLHDIGKFLQRTRNIANRPVNTHDYCPEYKGVRGYLHAADTVTFIEEYRHILPDGINFAVVRDLAAKHHKPQTSYEEIITAADRISAGSDRQSAPDESDENPKKRQFYTVPLSSIFTNVSLMGDKKSSRQYYKLKKLEPDLAVMEPSPEDSVDAKGYQDLWKKFVHDITAIPVADYDYFLDCLDSALLHYTWCIPSSTIQQNQTDVSLYDHLRTTAAFASVLFSYHEELGTLEDINSVRDKKAEKFLLVTGDLSGIQRYIFNLSSTKYSSKLLRAKSFQLQLLTDYFSGKLLKDLNLSRFCKINDAGGRFLLILPNTDSVKKYLKKFRLEVERYFIDQFFGELSLVISSGTAVSTQDLQQDNIKRVYEQMHRDSISAKQNKFSAVLTKPEDFMFSREYNSIDSSADVCLLCDKRKASPAADPLDHLRICPFCSSLKHLGEDLVSAKYIVRATSFWNRGYVLPDGSRLLFFRELSEIPEGMKPVCINRYEAGFPVRYLPFSVPRGNAENDVLTFEQIAEHAAGNEKIAMFKADVDNLGAIFSFGLGDAVSISRYATMSRMLDFFFSGILNRTISENYSSIYTVFSGGDDICVIGPWNEIFAFADAIQDQFSRFTAISQDITISAGIVLFSPSLPVSKVAKTAEYLLDDLAKKEPDKNSVAVFRGAFSWDDFRKSLELGRYLKDSKFSISTIYGLLNYLQMRRNLGQGKNVDRNGLWYSHLRYRSARIITDESKRKEFLNKVTPLFEGRRNQQILITAVHYALYITRNGGN